MPSNNNGLAYGLAVSALAALTLISFYYTTGEPPVTPCGLTNRRYAMSNEAYVDLTSNVQHPPFFRAGQDGPAMMVLGAGTHKDASVAMYLEPVAARRELKAFEGLSAPELRRITMPVDPKMKETFAAKGKSEKFSMSFYDALTYSDSTRSMRLVILNPVDQKSFVGPMAATLQDKLTQQGSENVQATIDAFKQLFGDESQFLEGDVLTFSAFKNGDFHFSFNHGTDAVMEKANGLNQAFWSLFTDESSPIIEARERFADRFPLLWLRAEAPEAVMTLSATGEESAAPRSVHLTMFDSSSNSQLTGSTTQVSPLFETDIMGDVSLYVDEDLVRTIPLQLSREETLEIIANTPPNLYTRGLRLNMDVDLSASWLIYELSTKMEGPLNSLLTKKQVGVALKNFRDIFPFTLNQNDEIFLMCNEENHLGLIVNGVSTGVVVSWQFSDEICSALMQAYLGSDSVLGDKRFGLVDNLVSA